MPSEPKVVSSYDSQLPQSTRDGEELRMVGKEVIGDFEVEVFEDTYITAVHCKYGHKYSAQWSTEVPHLRNEYCAPNDLAERDYKGSEDEAEEAMLRKLENDGLI